jgi:hypothetical protein
MTPRQLLKKLLFAATGAVVGLTALSFADDATPASPASAGAIFARHTVFPKDNPWNADISQRPVDPNSAAYIAAIGPDKPLHPDFGPGINGIPFQFVNRNTPRTRVTFDYADESDKGPYPIPAHPLIEGGPGATDGDRHMLLIDTDGWVLYELWQAVNGPGGWHAGSGAVWDLKTDAARPKGWTSADAAGLPVFPGLVRYDEVHEKRLIAHALRFSVQRTRCAYVSPASHWASSSKSAPSTPTSASFSSPSKPTASSSPTTAATGSSAARPTTVGTTTSSTSSPA